MAALTGTTVLNPVGFDLVNQGISTNISGVTEASPYNQGFSLDGGISGTATLNQPSSPVSVNLTGTCALGPHTLIFDYIHVKPGRFDYGNILTQQVDNFSVWNAYLNESHTVTALTETDTANNTQLTSGTLPPYTLGAMSDEEYELTVPVVGNFNIDASYDFSVPTANDVTLFITGTRIVLFSWRPQNNVYEMIEYLTEIQTSANGKEHRISLRQLPRRGISYTILKPEGRQRRKFDNTIWEWQGRNWGLPIWSDSSTTTVSLAASDITVVCDTTKRNFVDGGLAAIWESETNFEVVAVSNLTANGFDVTDGVVGNYPSGVFVIPVMEASIISKPIDRKEGQNHFSVEVDFLLNDNIDVDDWTPSTTYKTIPVIEECGIFADKTQSKKHNAGVYINDYKTGIFDVYSNWDNPKWSFSFGFVNENRDQTYELKQILKYLNGRQKPIWVPSGGRDLVPTLSIGSGDTTIRIENVDFTRFLNFDTIPTQRASVRFTDSNGNRYYRDIVDSSIIDDDEETIQIDSALGVALGINDVVIEFLYLTRLSSDRIEFEFLNSGTGYSEAMLNFTEISE